MSDTSVEPGPVAAAAATTLGLLARDLRVLRRELGPFLARTVMQPLLFVFVFAYVFPRIGQGIGASGAGTDFATVLVPGLVAIAIIFQGITAVALPLSNEFGGTKEIEDRILAPVPVQVIAIEKVLFGALQSILAGALVLPMVVAIPLGQVDLQVTSWPLLLAVAVLGGTLSGTLGLTLGTYVAPRQIGLMFSLVVLPLTFLGAVYYPWAALETLPWLQHLVLLNPLTYVSEGLRAALTPAVETMPVVVVLGALLAACAGLLGAGLHGFVRRTVG